MQIPSYFDRADYGAVRLRTVLDDGRHATIVMDESDSHKGTGKIGVVSSRLGRAKYQSG